MPSQIHATSSRATGPLATRRWIGWGVCVPVLPGGCGGEGGGATDDGVGVPTATQIADAQSALDGTAPTDDSIEARQAALDADADRDPE